MVNIMSETRPVYHADIAALAAERRRGFIVSLWNVPDYRLIAGGRVQR